MLLRAKHLQSCSWNLFHANVSNHFRSMKHAWRKCCGSLTELFMGHAWRKCLWHCFRYFLVEDEYLKFVGRIIMVLTKLGKCCIIAPFTHRNKFQARCPKLLMDHNMLEVWSCWRVTRLTQTFAKLILPVEDEYWKVRFKNNYGHRQAQEMLRVIKCIICFWDCFSWRSLHIRTYEG